MARDDSPPFGRGEYEPTDGAYDHLVGKEWVFEDINFGEAGAGGTLGAKAPRTNKKVRCRLVQNQSGGALLPKRLARFKLGTPDEALGVVDGMVAVGAGRGFPIDEFLPAAGVPDNGYFWLVMEGPALVKLPLAGAEFNGDVSVGDRLVALTAATSGATTAGRVAKENITGSTQAADYTFLFDQIGNRVGRALSAATTGNTNSDLLVDVTKD